MSLEGTVTIPRGLRKYRVRIDENQVHVESKRRKHHFRYGYTDVGGWRPVTEQPIDKRVALVVHDAIEDLLRDSPNVTEGTGDTDEPR